MKYFALIALTMLITQIVSQCGLPESCGDQSCCTCRQDPNDNDGNGYLEFDASCLTGGLHCINNTGCRLCYKPMFGSVNVGNRPVCARFSVLDDTCQDESCCESHQNPNPTDGNGYLEFNPSCLNGGLNCVANTGCQLCFKAVVGGVNVGNRPLCGRFSDEQVCNNDNCCIIRQDPNPTDGNGYQEFNPSCLNGGLNCIANTGCQLCYKPVVGGVDVGNRPICTRFTNTTACNSEDCCISRQNPNENDGNSFLEFNPSCLNGGLNCVDNTGCALCYKVVPQGVDVGDRPVCKRFSDSSVCTDEECCTERQNPNPTDGNSYLEFVQSCLDGGLNCVDKTGCALCYRPVIGSTNVGNRPVCSRFSGINGQICNNEVCCENYETPNPTNGNGYFEFNPSCLSGGLNCIDNTGCQLCYKPIFGSINVGNRPTCGRFTNLLENAICQDESCCESHQNPNSADGNGYLEFNATCLIGGVNCVATSGCQLCFNPVELGVNLGNRPTCGRF